MTGIWGAKKRLVTLSSPIRRINDLHIKVHPNSRFNVVYLYLIESIGFRGRNASSREETRSATIAAPPSPTEGLGALLVKEHEQPCTWFAAGEDTNATSSPYGNNPGKPIYERTTVTVVCDKPEANSVNLPVGKRCEPAVPDRRR